MTRAEREDRPEVQAFLLREEWPFHSGPPLTAADLQARFASGWLDGPGVESYWIEFQGDRSGLLRLFDLDDGAPLFDLRLAARVRGRGIGTEVVDRLTRHVFDGWPGVARIEATTRVDNIAMRRVLTNCGWVKESHWREAWISADGIAYDGVGYAILRRDYESGSVTRVQWDR